MPYHTHLLHFDQHSLVLPFSNTLLHFDRHSLVLPFFNTLLHFYRYSLVLPFFNTLLHFNRHPLVLPFRLSSERRVCEKNLKNGILIQVWDQAQISFRKSQTSFDKLSWWHPDYCNYKGLFSLLLLAQVDAEYRFLWIDCGSSGSSSDAQIFKKSNLREKIENDSLGLLAPEPLGKGRPNLHYFLLGEDALAFMPWVVKSYSRRQLTREDE